MKGSLIILILFLSLSVTMAQEKGKTFTVMFYNVENLFDTVDAPDFEDQEFLPGSEKEWNTQRYRKKLEDLARVIAGVGGNELPALVGMAEIENEDVLNDLIHTGPLAEGNYAIAHEESPDVRGIDVALLYRKDEFKYISHDRLRIYLPDSAETTRDILYVKGEADDGKNLHVFVNHWSSRREGMKETEPKRLMAAVNLRKKVDLLMATESDPRFIIMGDFNDEPTNRSINEILKASDKRKNVAIGDLYNLFYEKHNINSEGTYNFRGTWNMLDQIIVSYNLINQSGSYSTGYDGGKIFRKDFMIYKTDEGQEVPNKTYGGPNYYGGISDHFPVYVVFSRGE